VCSCVLIRATGSCSSLCQAWKDSLDAGWTVRGGGSRTRPYGAALSVSVIPPLHNRDLLLGQPVHLTHQCVDLGIGGLDLALVELLVGEDGRCPLAPRRRIGSTQLSGILKSQAGEDIVRNGGCHRIPGLAIKDPASPCSALHLGAAILLVEAGHRGGAGSQPPARRVNNIPSSNPAKLHGSQVGHDERSGSGPL
jgi:hypothetical protein